VQFAGTILAPVFRLERGGVLWGEAAEGRVEGAAGQEIPMGGAGISPVLHIPVAGMDGLTVQEQLVRLHVKLGGLGLGGLEDTCELGFLTTLLQAVSYLASVPALQQAWGGPWKDEVAAGVGRFGAFLDSSLSHGLEMRAAWAGRQRGSEGRGR
jgi:hypothetical protein